MKLSDHNKPEKSSLRKEFGQMLEQHLESLPENFRMVFLLREVEKMNVADTAGALNISESNVKVRLNRAKEMLRNSLLSSYPIEELYEFNLSRCSRVATNVLARI